MNQEAERIEEMGFDDLDKMEMDYEECKSNNSGDESEDEEETKAQGDEGTSQEGEAKDNAKDVPKQGMSAYFLFLNSVREEIKQDHPGISYADFGKMVEEKWIKADQKKWIKKARLDQQGCENEIKTYNKTKGKRDKDAPRQGRSAYFLFLTAKKEEIKEQNPGVDYFEIKKKAGEMFKELEDKSEWEEKALLDQQRYENEMKDYKTKAEKDNNAPSAHGPQRPLTAFSFFLKARRKEIKEQNPGIQDRQMKKKAIGMFKELEDKSEWEEKALLHNAEKDKNRPAYLQFLNAKREEIMEQNPGIRDYEIKKKATQLFEELEDKSEWEEKALLDYTEKNKDRPAYLQFMNAKKEEIKKENPGIDDFEIKRKATIMFKELEDNNAKSEKDKGAPRTGKAFIIFLNAKREEIKEQNPGIDDFLVRKKAAEMFQELEDKSEWEEKVKENEEKAKKDRKRKKNKRKKIKQAENKKTKKMMYEM